MHAATFERLLVEHLAEPVSSLGFERWGKGLWYEHPGGRQLARRGEDAWCERRWIEDYDRILLTKAHLS